VAHAAISVRSVAIRRPRRWPANLRGIVAV